MKTRLLLAFLCLGTALVGATRAETPILPFDEVRPGMRGVGRTVFEGTTVEEFSVEILGTLPNIGPDQDLILARCSGGPLADTGVLAGMSGSPVMVDGKLIGAIAYSWGFSTEPIAGITPIEEMLAISRRDTAPRSLGGGRLPLDRDRLSLLEAPDGLAAHFSSQLRGLLQHSGALAPTAVPLAIAGIDGHALERLAPDLTRAGFLPMQTGSGGGNPGPPPRLEPGSAMGLKLVRGDVEMTATGTVTWVDGDRVLAFGHPLFGLGAVDLPLTGAKVQALLPSLNQSSKIATPLGEVGAIRQDRASGVFGRIGATPRMIPVRLQLSGGGDDRAYSFDIADDPLLAPLLLYTTLNGILASRERVFGSVTVTIAEGSVIKMLDGDDVELDNVFAGNSAPLYGTGIPAYILQLLMNNSWSPPQIAGVNLILDYENEPRIARVRRASLDRYSAKPGDSVTATVVVRPYRGPDRVFNREIRIPEGTPAGTLSVYVGGAAAASGSEDPHARVLPESLEQLVRLINQLRRNDRVYVVAYQEDSGVLLGGSRLPNLPPSANRVLSRPRTRGNLSVVSQRGVLEESIPTGFAMEGLARLQLRVESR